MSALQYCQERAPAVGSSSYYAWRLGSNRIQCLSVYVLLKELFAIVSISESSVAYAKLAWWRDELARLAMGQQNHPLSQALSLGGLANHDSVEQLLLITEAVETDLKQSRFLDAHSLTRYLTCAAAAPALAIARANQIEGDSLNAVARLGVAIGRARLVIDAGRHARQQRIYFPQEILRQLAVPAADLLNHRDTPNLRELARLEAHAAGLELAQGLRLLTRRQRRAMRSQVVLAGLAAATLREVGEDGYRVALHRVTLTPLRKLLIGWRSVDWFL